MELINIDGQTRQRATQLGAKLASSPVLPMLGFTKFVESIVATGPTGAWFAYCVLVTLGWVFADDIQRNMDRAGDGLQENVERADEALDRLVVEHFEFDEELVDAVERLDFDDEPGSGERDPGRHRDFGGERWR